MDMPQHLAVWLRTFDEPGEAIPLRLLRGTAAPAATDTRRDLERSQDDMSEAEIPGEAGQRSDQA